MDIAKDTGQGLGLRWSGTVLRGRNLKIVSRISPESIVACGSCCMADWPLRCTLLALADELREAMAELRLRRSPPTRCAMFLNAASSAVAVYICPVSVGLLEFPALVDLVTLAGMAGRVRVRGWDSNPGPADYESGTRHSANDAADLPERHRQRYGASSLGRVFAMIKVSGDSRRDRRRSLVMGFVIEN